MDGTFSEPSAVLRWLFSLGCLLGSATAAAETGEDVIALSLEELAVMEVHVVADAPGALRTAPSVATRVSARDLDAFGAPPLDEAPESVSRHLRGQRR